MRGTELNARQRYARFVLLRRSTARGLKAGHAGYKRIDARVFLETDAPRDAVEALHADVLRTSCRQHVRVPALTVELAELGPMPLG